MQRTKNIVIIFLLIIISANNIFAQTSGFTDEERSKYILDIVKKPEWSNINEITEFKISVIEKEKSLFNALTAEAARRKTVHGKPIKIIHLDALDDLGETQVLYFEKHETGTDIYLASNKIAGKKVLLITENYE